MVLRRDRGLRSARRTPLGWRGPLFAPLVLLLVLCAAPLAVVAAEMTEKEALQALFAAPDTPPQMVYRPDLARAEVQEALSARHPGYLAFLAEHPGRWLAEWNEAEGTAHRIYGDGFPLLLEDGRSPESGPEMESAARSFFGSHPGLFPIDPDELELEISKDLGPFRLLRFRQLHAGVPVLGGRAEVWVAPGARAILVGADVVPERLLAELSPVPRIVAEEAVGFAAAHAGRLGRGFRPHHRELSIVPTREGRRLLPRLAWKVHARGAGPGESWVYLVLGSDDPAAPRGRGAGMRTGQLIASWSEVLQGTVSGLVRGNASPGLLPDASWNPPRFEPAAGLQVNAGTKSTVTGADGSYSLTYSGTGSVTVTVALRGPFCQVRNTAGADLSFSKSATNGSTVAIDFNSTPAEATTAQVNAFQSVNRIHGFYKGLDPSFAAIDKPILTEVNIDQNCNAYFLAQDNGILNFFRSNPCANSAYSTVIYHEYTHFVVWKAFGSVEPMTGYNEGVADTGSALFTDQPRIGSSFNGLQGGAPIRDISASTLHYPQDILLEPHYAGLIVSGSFWSLRQGLGSSLGSAEGLDLTRHLFLKSLFLAPVIISPQITVDLLHLDDDDGVLQNGTPHFDQITAAFGAHGLSPPGRLRIAHTRLADSTGRGPFQVQCSVSSDFGFLTPTAANLHYSIDGGFHYSAEAMTALGGGDFQAEIPAQAAGTTVLYYLDAAGTAGAQAVFPAGAPADETVGFAVGGPTKVFADNFDGAETGWTHGIIPNSFSTNRDDWQRGTPRLGTPDPNDYINGNLLDPPSAFSAPNCWGNDLGLGGLSDKNYPDDVSNFLQSPAIDCTGKSGIHLRFHRWLTMERSDRARVLVNGVVVYQSPSTRDTIDLDWRSMDYDVSGQADGKKVVVVRFEISSNVMGNGGGWNVDDVALVATGTPAIPRPTLSSIDPPFDFKTGGAPFTLHGSGFTTTADTRLTFAQSQATGFTVVDPATITGTIPASAAAGPAAISVENAGGAGALPAAFTYFDLPTLDGVIPPRGRLAGGDTVTVHGSYYTAGSDVLIGGKSLQPLSLVGHEALIGTLPPGDDIGAKEVVIRTIYGESRFPAAFTYVEPPTLTGVLPSSGPLQGGEEFRLQGTFFPDHATEVTINFGSHPVTAFSVLSRTEISGIVPAADQPGKVDVQITTPGGAAALAGGFLYGDRLFIRGDANLDGVIEISDPIDVLTVLFLGAGKLPCIDAADANDDGELDISDPVAVLIYLFAGGAPPASPHPEAGVDPTPDILGCEEGLAGSP